MIELQAMTESDFQKYLTRAVETYAAEKVKAGNWREDEALDRSRKEFNDLLPEGIHTADHFLYNIVNEACEKVGFLWFALAPRRTEWYFIYDFEIYEVFRRRGYAFQALAKLDEFARGRGIETIELHVFGHNTAARELYKKAGFIEANVMMTKEIR